MCVSAYVSLCGLLCKKDRVRKEAILFGYIDVLMLCECANNCDKHFLCCIVEEMLVVVPEKGIKSSSATG